MNRSLWSLLIGLLLLAACGDDEKDPVDPGPSGSDYQTASTEDKMIENLERAYAERNFSEFANLLASGFEFYFAQEDIQDVQKEFWNRQEELNATERMFSGQPSRDGESIQSITITLIPLGAGGWSTEVPDEFAGSVSRNYCVNMDVQAGDTTFQVRGLQRYYAVAEEVGGEQVFQLVGWEDFGSNEDCGFKGKGTVDSTWGSVKSQF